MLGQRRFIDSTGFAWQVCEVVADSAIGLADRPAVPGWLYFFSRGTTLVIRDFPETWEELSALELDQLRRRAAVLGADSPVRLGAPTRGLVTSVEARL